METFSRDEALHVVHELQVHQIELEMQNEELRQAHAALDILKAKYYNLFELAPMGFIVLSKGDAITEANLAATQMLARERQSLPGLRFTRFIAPDSQDQFYLGLHTLKMTGEQQTFELRCSTDTDPNRWLLATISPPGVGESDQICWMALLDITERKTIETKLANSEAQAFALVNQLQRTDQNKNQFLHTLSHELRNPLAAITMGLALIERVSPGSREHMRAKEVLNRQVAQLTHLVDDLLDVTRITQNKVKLKRKPIELTELVQRTVDDFQPDFTEKGIALECEFPEEPVSISADSVRLTQAIGNLLHNALKFTNTGGRVAVKLQYEHRSGEATLTVRDTGAGIDPQMLSRIFDPFTQADNSLDRAQGGLGLGLSVVKGMVELHGGRVTAESDGPGTGATFTIHLPVGVQTRPVCAALSQQSPEDCSHLRILLIEDNSDMSVIFEQLLRMLGHEAMTAANGADGIRTAREAHPDVVICDIGLPDMSGYEVASRIRQSLDPVPYLIALSGYALPEDLAKARAAGFKRHMSKPVELDAIRQLLSEIPSRGLHMG